MSNLFEKVTGSTRKPRTEKVAATVPAESLERVAAFHEALSRIAGETGADRKLAFRSTGNAVRWERMTAQAIARKVQAIAKSQGLKIQCSAVPAGRDDSGSVLYAVHGWIPRERDKSNVTV